MIKAAIVGATGYAGQELVRLLMMHPEAAIISYGSRSSEGEKYSDIYLNMNHFTKEKCTAKSLEELSKEADVIFTATPQGYCAGEMKKEVLNHCKVIDLSADFRLKDVSVYESWYHIVHKSPEFIKDSVYGLCEINRQQIKNTRLLANPGCYTTCSILTAYPLVKEGIIQTDTLIIDAKSGTSGAGRSAKLPNLYCEVNESIKAYGVAAHRHTPEIEEQLSYAAGKPVTLSFTPHLVPMNRGILVTEYATLAKNVTRKDVEEIYQSYYGNEPFIRLLKEGILPETRWVKQSNFVDLNFVIDARTNRIIMLGALDNLVKGAAGQAVQNMNLMFGLDETTGLLQPPCFP